MPFSTRTRRLLGLIVGLVALAAVLIHTVPFVGMAWAALTGGPDLGLVRDVRARLLAQETVRQTLAEHEKEALHRHRTSGSSVYQRRHLVRVNLTPFGLPGFHDVFAVRVRTDIVEGTAYTSFLARPGVVIDANASTFFSGQCGGAICRRLVRTLAGSANTLLEWGVLSPFRLNVTEMDATSSVSHGRDPVSTKTWARHSLKLHQDGIGRSFASPTPQ